MKLKDFIIIDDPIKPDTKVDRKAVKERFNKLLSSRFNTVKPPIIIMARLPLYDTDQMGDIINDK